MYGDDRRTAGVGARRRGVALGVAAGAASARRAVATTWRSPARALGDAAARRGHALGPATSTRARALLPALVGRDPSALDEPDVARAVVESVAENTVDAVVAPALWAAAAGAPGVLAHRAVNTMDAMVGPPRATATSASAGRRARLDDAAAWVPARVTAALVAPAARRRPPRCGGPCGGTRRRIRRPTAGWPRRRSRPRSACASAARAATATGSRRARRSATAARRRPHDIERAVALSRDVTVALAGAPARVGRSRPRRGEDGR